MRYCRLLLLMAMVAWVGSAQTPGAPVYACVQISGNVLGTFTILTDGGRVRTVRPGCLWWRGDR